METIQLEPSAWRVAAGEHRFAEHLGRPAVWLRDGFAFAEDVAFRDGTLAFDIALTPERNFAGAIWRVVDDESFE